jgi:hypothetical protein
MKIVKWAGLGRAAVGRAQSVPDRNGSLKLKSSGSVGSRRQRDSARNKGKQLISGKETIAAVSSASAHRAR